MSVIVKCPACGANNRIKDDADSAQKPVCGKCKTPLLIQQVSASVQLTDATFEPYIRKAHRPVLVDFWAGWCQPCRVLDPVLKAFAQSQHSITIAKLDTENNPFTPSRFSIFSIPTMILFENGQEVKRITGAVNIQTLEAELKPWIKVN